MKAKSILDLSATTGRMGREHSEYRGWRLCVAKDRTCIGHGVRESPPHRLVTAIITEAGVITPPYELGLRRALGGSPTVA